MESQFKLECLGLLGDIYFYNGDKSGQLYNDLGCLLAESDQKAYGEWTKVGARHLGLKKEISGLKRKIDEMEKEAALSLDVFVKRFKQGKCGPQKCEPVL